MKWESKKMGQNRFQPNLGSLIVASNLYTRDVRLSVQYQFNLKKIYRSLQMSLYSRWKELKGPKSKAKLSMLKSIEINGCKQA